ncbi:hypothetical protein LCGC14_1440530 [marine sediment metagenome]|uniref:KilA-N DNA-binding domain-containing protein n=1 Tax=marine sediment metagenome TaxID=412755 RepID=A0A0F9M1E3_9ZZZZ
MSETIKFEDLQDRIIELRSQIVLLDADGAEIYGVETKRINEAVKNNPDKFPTGYVIELDKTEWDGLKSKFSTSIKGGKVKLPSAFPEKGLHMLATILKSPQAVRATFLKARRRFGRLWLSLKPFQRSGNSLGTLKLCPQLRIKGNRKT